MSANPDVWNQTAAPTAAPIGVSIATILLVEDEEALSKLVSRLLILNRYRVLSADDARSAIALWERHRDEIDLLLTDLTLPSGLSGRELATKFQSENAALRIIFMSGYSMEISAEEGCPDEEITFLQKPYRPEELLGAVRCVLAKPFKPGIAC
jgi:DNA-binding NtrC family response regulator